VYLWTIWLFIIYLRTIWFFIISCVLISFTTPRCCHLQIWFLCAENRTPGIRRMPGSNPSRSLKHKGYLHNHTTCVWWFCKIITLCKHAYNISNVIIQHNSSQLSLCAFSKSYHLHGQDLSACSPQPNALQTLELIPYIFSAEF
jgi:hypothetical protein